MLSQKKTAVYWAKGKLYILAGENEIYYTGNASAVILSLKYWDAICFIDSDAGHVPPAPMLTSNRHLFILQAASPSPKHIEWTKQRALVVKFVLNPPSIPKSLQRLCLILSSIINL